MSELPKVSNEYKIYLMMKSLQAKSGGKDIMSNISWTVDEMPSEARTNPPINSEADFIASKDIKYEDLPKADLKEIVWSTELTIKIPVCDAERNISATLKPDTKDGVTSGAILSAIYKNCNQTPVPRNLGRKWKAHFYPDPTERIDSGQPVYWRDSMGDHVYFEGISIDSNGIGTVIFGS